MVASDADRVRAVLGGDQSAYADLYDRHAPLIRAICCDITRDLTLAQDLSQEVFLKAYCKLSQLHEPERFAGWLVGIARNECRDWLRRQGRDRHEYREHVPDVTDENRPDRDGQQIALLTQAMQSLPERERMALHAFYLQGESAEVIRDVLGLSRPGVYRLLDRAREQLGQLLIMQQEDI